MNENIILMIVQLITGAVSTLLAIVLWSKTREAAWLLVIIAIILSYGRILFGSLEYFGIVRLETPIPIFNLVARGALDNFPTIFLSIALIIMINRRA